MKQLGDGKIDNFFGTYERPERWKCEVHNHIKRRVRRMSVKKDCFAYRIGGCSIMTETICKRDACSFYKTREQAELDREKYGFQKNYRPKGERL